MSRQIVFDQAFFEALRRVQIAATHSSGGRLEGARVSRRGGAGIEFADWRPYASGDSPREIDYRALARLGRVFVRVRAREEASEVYVLVDASASMGAGRPPKFTYARRLAAAVAAVGLATMDAVTVGMLRGGACELAGRLTGAESVVEVLRFLEGRVSGGTTDLASALPRALDAARTGGVIVLFSDLWTDGDLTTALRLAAERGFEGALVQTLDPQEIAPPRGGRVRLVDAESGDEMEIVASDAAVAAYVEERRAHFDELRSRAAGLGFRMALVSTATALEDAVLVDLRAAGVLV